MANEHYKNGCKSEKRCSLGSQQLGSISFESIIYFHSILVAWQDWISILIYTGVTLAEKGPKVCLPRFLQSLSLFAMLSNVCHYLVQVDQMQRTDWMYLNNSCVEQKCRLTWPHITSSTCQICFFLCKY